MKPSGNTIVVTGGGSGIGRGLAHRLHDLGNVVVVAGRRRDALDETVGNRVGMHTMAVDASDAGSVEAFRQALVAAHPDVNILINNAGIMRFETIDARRDLGDAAATIETNLMGPIRLVDALVEHLSARPDAAIVNVTSGLGFVPLVVAPTYSATKAALHSYTVSLRAALAGRVEVIELAPPGVQTALTPGQATRSAYQPLDDFLDEVMAQWTAASTPREILVERVRPFRTAEADGRFDERFEGLNAFAAATRAARDAG